MAVVGFLVGDVGFMGGEVFLVGGRLFLRVVLDFGVSGWFFGSGGWRSFFKLVEVSQQVFPAIC